MHCLACWETRPVLLPDSHYWSARCSLLRVGYSCSSFSSASSLSSTTFARTWSSSSIKDEFLFIKATSCLHGYIFKIQTCILHMEDEDCTVTDVLSSATLPCLCLWPKGRLRIVSGLGSFYLSSIYKMLPFRIADFQMYPDTRQVPYLSLIYKSHICRWFIPVMTSFNHDNAHPAKSIFLLWSMYKVHLHGSLFLQT